MAAHTGITKNQICKNCGIRFDADRFGRSFCSNKCRGENMKGKPLKMNLSGLNYICKKDESKHKKSICDVCGKEFEHRIIKSVTRYCSNECWANRIEKKTIKCKYCGKDVILNQKNPQVYCGKQCYYNWMSENFKGENSHFYINGSCKETQNERILFARELRTWRAKVFKRDNFRCVKCNSKINIQAHHVKHWAKSKESRFDVDNGITVCLECHQIIHKKKINLPYFEAAKKRIINHQKQQNLF